MHVLDLLISIQESNEFSIFYFLYPFEDPIILFFLNFHFNYDCLLIINLIPCTHAGLLGHLENIRGFFLVKGNIHMRKST